MKNFQHTPTSTGSSPRGVRGVEKLSEKLSEKNYQNQGCQPVPRVQFQDIPGFSRIKKCFFQDFFQAKNSIFQDFPGFHRCVRFRKPQFSRIFQDAQNRNLAGFLTRKKFKYLTKWLYKTVNNVMKLKHWSQLQKKQK